MENSKLYLAIFVIIVLACGGGGLYTKSVLDSDPTFWAEYEAAKAESQTPEYQARMDAQNEANAKKIEPYLWGAFVLFLVFVFAGDILRAIGKPLLVLACMLALLAGVSYLFVYSDGKSLVITSVDPTGDNAKIDKAYSEVNNENAKANMTNMLTLGFMWVIGAIVIFVLGFIAIYLGSWRKENI